MRIYLLLLSALCFHAPFALAQISPETITRETMSEPSDTWVMVKSSFGPHYIFDAATGDMHGMLSLTKFTPSVQPHLGRNEIYAAESYYSRVDRGERTDVVTVYDSKTLSPTAEIKIPNKVAALPFRQYIGLLNEDKYLGVFNLTPAQSVSIVDVEDRVFVGEISTPGCSLIMPSENRSFMQICGDGTLQLITLDTKGKESARTRSKSIFDIDEDPVYDKPVPTQDGWLLLSFEGEVFEATYNDEKIALTEPWSILTKEDKKARWKPGGGQILAYHKNLDLIFTLMHQGGKDTHEDAGTEVWVFNKETKRRISRIKLETHGTSIHVGQSNEALLTVTAVDSTLRVYDVAKTKPVRTIKQVGNFVTFIQGFQR